MDREEKKGISNIKSQESASISVRDFLFDSFQLVFLLGFFSLNVYLCFETNFVQIILDI